MTLTRPLHDALYHYYCEFDAIALLQRFARADQVPSPDAVTNFLGVATPVAVFPPILTPLAGKIEGLPVPGNWHADVAEWAGALQAVERASGTFRIVELGCGWGCWLVNMGRAARDRGLSVDLIGIEGDRHHLDNAHAVLQRNGFSDRDFTLHHGVAGPKAGQAIFPNPDADQAAWGGEAIFYPDAETLAQAAEDSSVQILTCQTLADLSGAQPIDLLHIDIQGAEVDYVKGNMEGLQHYVRHVLIGTHSRVIEGQLMSHFSEAGWHLEMERPAVTPLKNGAPRTQIDGIQVWRNPQLNLTPAQETTA